MGLLQDLVRELAKTGEEIYSVVCTVKSVDDQKRTCVASPKNGDADLLDVRLQSEQSSSTGLYIKPSVNSDVLVTFLSKNTAYVALCTAIDSIELKIGTQTIKVDGTNGLDVSGFFKVASATSDLKSALDEFIDTMAQMNIVVTGPAGVLSPPQILLLQALKLKIATFLK